MNRQPRLKGTTSLEEKSFDSLRNAHLSPEFKPGDAVFTLSFRRADSTWVPGVILSVLSLVNYQVQVEDVVWKRHRNQLRPRSVPLSDLAERLPQRPTHPLPRPVAPQPAAVVSPSPPPQERPSTTCETTTDSTPPDSAHSAPTLCQPLRTPHQVLRRHRELHLLRHRVLQSLHNRARRVDSNKHRVRQTVQTSLSKLHDQVVQLLNLNDSETLEKKFHQLTLPDDCEFGLLEHFYYT